MGYSMPSVYKLLREKLWQITSFYVRLRDKKLGDWCRICRKRPIECAYHLVPKQRGLSIYYNLDNLVGACAACNFGEHLNRSLYRDKHIVLFGKERIERLEAEAAVKIKLTRDQLQDMIENVRKLTEAL